MPRAAQTQQKAEKANLLPKKTKEKQPVSAELKGEHPLTEPVKKFDAGDLRHALDIIEAYENGEIPLEPEKNHLDLNATENPEPSISPHEEKAKNEQFLSHQEPVIGETINPKTGEPYTREDIDHDRVPLPNESALVDEYINRDGVAEFKVVLQRRHAEWLIRSAEAGGVTVERQLEILVRLAWSRDPYKAGTRKISSSVPQADRSIFTR